MTIANTESTDISVRKGRIKKVMDRGDKSCCFYREFLAKYQNICEQKIYCGTR